MHIVRIIPVIDLLDGIVVHAKQGQRKQYQPIVSPLSASSHPMDIVKAFVEIYPFDTLYIADLNAIQRLGSDVGIHQSIIAEIQQAFPQLSIWLDAGIRHLDDAKQWQSMNVSLVLGTESIESLASYRTIVNALPDRTVLSLDFMPDGYQGLDIFIESTKYWPQDVIVMTLSHVGAQQGVAIEILSGLAQRGQHHHLYAAGGVRNLADIALIKHLGIHGALIATALHTQQINSVALKEIYA